MVGDEAYVFDATPLIYLTRAGVFELLARLRNPFLIPRLVGREVIDAGREKGAPEVLLLERLVSEGRIRIGSVRSRTVLKRLREDPGLSDADRESLALAVDRRARLIADEAALRSAARAFGVSVGGSLFLLRRLVDEGLLSPSEAGEALDRLIAHGWFCSPALYRSVASLFV